jgi:hypothetical protein
MLLEEEIFGLEIFDGGVESVVIEKNGAEDGAFGVEILRERAFESGFGRHCESFVSPFIRFIAFCFAASKTGGPKNFRGDWLREGLRAL